MRIEKLIELLPNSVKLDILDFKPVKLKDGSIAERITIDRILTDKEKKELAKHKNIIGLDCVASYKYAPEIKKSYFYIKQDYQHIVIVS